MDVNLSPMFRVAGRRAFGLAGDDATSARNLQFVDAAGQLRLARQQDAPTLAEDEMFARLAASAPSPLADGLGGFAWWNAAARQLEASGFAPGRIAIPLPSAEESGPVAPTDFALGTDDVIYVAQDGAVVWRDLRGRWPAAEARRGDFHADLLAPFPGGGVWAFDRTERRAARASGYPLRVGGLSDPDPARFQPADPNIDPPRLSVLRAPRIPDEIDIVAIAASPSGRLALLGWETGAPAAVFTLEDSGFVERFRLAGLRFPFSIGWMGEESVAVLASDGAALARQAFVYPMDLPPAPGLALPPDGRVHPLIDARPGRFCNAPARAATYLTQAPADAEEADIPAAARPLRPLSGAAFARAGHVLVGPIDSGETGCVWHRLYADASTPDGTAIRVDVLATDSPAPVDAEEAAPESWAPHLILPPGAAPREAIEGQWPRAAWCADESELANAPSELSCPRAPGRAGLFTLLLQHPGRRVRRIEGRYLWLRIGMSGDSQASPELASLRVYARRFSYRDRYLPGFYREALGGEDARAAGPATPHDFMERMLGAFEGVLTEIEGKVAGAWQVTDPAVAPEAALRWIGSWIGTPTAAGEDTDRLRQTLLAAPYTAGLNGTAAGLLAALELGTGGVFITGGTTDPDRPPAPGALAIARMGDIAIRALTLGARESGAGVMLAGGAVTGGAIVVVEGFRLRRTFATILGADLAEGDDPLTLGMMVSGNSHVGDTLILGDAARDELLALYRDEIDAGRGDAQAVADFYSRLAHRVLVLVRGVDDPAEMARLCDIVEAAIPAHVEANLHQASAPLIVGAASLVGVDTYLVERPEFEVARLERSRIGRGDFVAGSGRLDGRADGPVSRPPVARADGPAEVWWGSGFTLSAAQSSAARGRSINRHIWTWE